MRVVVSPLAERDLEAIGDYIAEDNPARALSFVEELRTQCAVIAKAPQVCRARPELGESIRSLAHGNYVIFFTATKTRLTIVRVLHGAMDIPAQFPARRTDRVMHQTMNEAETRAEHIDPALKAARGRRQPCPAYPIIPGHIESHGRRGKPFTADYVLEYRNIKLAVVEAKAWEEKVSEGVAQAKNHAGILSVRFTYSTNG